ncbi:MAG: peptidyl-prolyl cis-trans isomerase [Candidatus Poribacteria bacterium]|nr:peptidyl-prolyl cis-trans isomerase [Candidatus Poribacteria bacterium]
MLTVVARFMGRIFLMIRKTLNDGIGLTTALNEAPPAPLLQAAIIHESKSRIIPLLLIGILVTHPIFYSCGDKAIGADGTVIAEFDWNGKQRITLEEMMQEISELPEYKQRQYQDKEGLETYMVLMAESRLILNLARDEKLNEDPEILKKVQDYLHELMVKKITAQEVDDKLSLTEDDYIQYYEANKQEYVRPEQVRLSCITLLNKERADEVYAQIKEGKDILEIAQELSDRGELVGPGANPSTPGDTDYISRDAFPSGTEPFLDAAFDAEIGQTHEGVVEVDVQGQKYYMMFRKDEARDEYQKPFEEEDVRKSVVRKAEREKRQELMDSWITQLRERSEVKTYIDRIPEGESEESEEPSVEDQPEEAPVEAEPEE